MKSIIFFLSLIFSSFAFGQDMPEPISWKFEVVSGDQDVEIVQITADIDEGWHLYSQFTDEGGPIPTEFTFESEDIELLGDVEEITEAKRSFSEMFEIDVVQFSKKAVFNQKFKRNGAKSIKGEVYFMTCDGNRCLPPKPVSFEIDL